MSKSLFSERLQQVLTAREWSQGRLAAYAQVAQSHISMLLTGERGSPSVEVAYRIAKALGVSLDWLTGLPPVGEDQVSPDEQELLALYRELHPDARRMFLEVTRSQVKFANRISRAKPPTPNSEPSTDKT